MKEPSSQSADEEENIGSYNQIEVSHGSTSNEGSIYASSTTYVRTCSCYCDFVLVSFIIIIMCFLVMFWFDRIPMLSDLVASDEHHHLKLAIFYSCVAIMFLIFTILVIRCFMRVQNPSCANRLKYIFCHRRMESQSTLSLLNSGDSCLSNDGAGVRQRAFTTPKVHELQEEDLIELQKILEGFLKYHDKNEWRILASSFSPYSYTQNVSCDDKVKLKVSMKIVLVGDPNVGKTSLFHRILYDRFTEYYMSTLGVDLGFATLQLYPQHPENNIIIYLQLWDIAGSDSFSELAHIIYRDTNAYLLICDITEGNYSAYAIPWIRDIQHAVYQPYISLFYNKIDIDNQTGITYDKHELAMFDEYRVSAKTGEMVLENLVDVVARSLLHEIDKYIS